MTYPLIVTTGRSQESHSATVLQVTNIMKERPDNLLQFALDHFRTCELQAPTPPGDQQ